MKKFKPDDKIVSTLKSDEGYRRYVYRCSAGKLTIAFGRNLSDVGISMEEAEYLLMNDIQTALDETIRVLPWASKLSENRLCVLVMMTFNIGIKRLLRFKNMLAALEKGDYSEAASEMLNSLWSKQVKGRAHRLAEIMLTDRF